MLCVVEQPDSTASAALATRRERPLMIFLFILFGGVRVIGSASNTLSEQSQGNFAIAIIAPIFRLAWKSGLVIYANPPQQIPRGQRLGFV